MHSFKFWGSATIGTKGQVVIPAEARKQLGFNEGDKILIMSTHDAKGIVAVKPDVLEEFMKKATMDMQNILRNIEEHK